MAKSKFSEMLKKSGQRESLHDDSDDDEVLPPMPQKGLKINNSGSSVKAPAPPQIDILSQAAKIENDRQLQFKLIGELTVAIMGVFKDKTLDENKTEQDRQSEQKMFTNFIRLAGIINNSPVDQDPDTGTFAAVGVLFRILQLQRDTLNSFDRKVWELNKEIERLKLQQANK